MTEKGLAPVGLTNQTIESMIYEIRGQKVMLDFDLAMIYGYETRTFNQQIRNNINKFPERYRFRLNKDEANSLRSKNLILNKNGSKRGMHFKYLPYAFTEQGIYMLMTVLKGDLATKQSIALIDAFKSMKDYIVENNGVLLNTNPYIESRFASIDKRFEVVEHKIDLVMDNFIDESTYKHFIILDGEKLEADLAYQDIYSKAKSSILVIDDYIDIKTLQLLKSSKPGIAITVISDNKARNGLNANFVKDSMLSITFRKNNELFHDRYIVVDYRQSTERVFHCGASSKDAGNRITAINELNDAIQYYPYFDRVLTHPLYDMK